MQKYSVIFTNLSFFLGLVYFSYGRKHPVMVFKGYEYLIKTSCQTKTIWRCNKEFQKCKVRVMSTGKTLIIKNTTGHNHQPTYKGDYSTLSSQPVFVKYASSFSCNL